MKELEQAVSNSFSSIVSSGVIEKAIEDQLIKTINGIIKSELESYSAFGKQVQGHVKQALQVDLSNLGLPGYNDLILKIVRKQVDAQIESQLAAQVEKQMAELLEPSPGEITLSKLVEEFIEYNKNDDCSCDGPSSISLHVDASRHGSRWISMDKDDGRSEYSCEIRFAVHEEDGRIYSLKINDKEVEKALFVGSIYGFERRLFQMYAAGTKLIVDAEADDIDTNYPGRD